MMNRSSSTALLDRVRLRMAAASGGADLSELAREESPFLVDETVLSEMSGALAAELRGAGPLEVLLCLPGITDVLVNAADDVWIDRGNGLERTSVAFADDAAIRRLAVRLALQAGRRLDDAAPYVDATLPDGTRLHAILPPLVAHPTISLRVLARRRLALSDLVALGAMPMDVAALLQACLAARQTLLVSGGTGSGKTTLLAALLGTIDATERIITIEDAAELAVTHPHVVSLIARSANVEHTGAVELRELVRQALRMRADRLVVGEFRGGEIVELLTALNTGHPGGAATVHANSVYDVPTRLVALAALGGQPADVLRAQAASALDVLVHVVRDHQGARYVDQIALWPSSAHLAEAALVWSRSTGIAAGAMALRARLSAAGGVVPTILAERP
jgi:pilus assembly protein CpaF